MRIIRAADCRRMAWKNGGGETTEIASHPEGAGLDDFVWRLSAAHVSQDGPFSLFPGVDRTLAVLAGEGLELRVAGGILPLGPQAEPCSFAADQPTTARLLGGPVDDLNIMTRRGVARHRMRRLVVAGLLPVSVQGTTALLFCGDGRVTVNRQVLAPRDTAVVAAAGGIEVAAEGAGTLYVIEIDEEP